MNISSQNRQAFAIVAAFWALCGSPSALAQQLAPAPEAATGKAVHALGQSSKYMVAAANPLAAEAGREILREGGSAVDAAIAVQMVLNLVEPQSSGLGGGAFLLFWDEKSRSMTSLDGREKAPAAATPYRFLSPDGKPMAFMDAVVGGRSVGVPGTLRLLEVAHKKWGKLPWSRLFDRAITLAEKGFAVSPRLAGLLAQEKFLATNPTAKAYFYDADGKPLPAGTTLKNPNFANTLRSVASEGASAFYSGPVAEDIIGTIHDHPTNPGDMTLADLANYQVIERAPVCGPYHAFLVCSMGPPSSGGVALAQIFGILNHFDLAKMGEGAEAAHYVAEAGRLAFADRALYLGDPDFADIPVAGLIDHNYVDSRASLVSPDRSMGQAQAGHPQLKHSWRFGPSDGVERGTSHIDIIDESGNALAMTTTIEDAFGARLMTKGGFLLNNELTDFNFVPYTDGKPAINRLEANKRPRSSMSPTIVLDAHNHIYALAGSAGGSQIIAFVAKTLFALIDWHKDPQTAVDMANFGSRNGPTELELGSEAAPWAAALEAKGHKVRIMDLTSGTQAIVATPQGYVGGADFRREGVAIGD